MNLLALLLAIPLFCGLLAFFRVDATWDRRLRHLGSLLYLGTVVMIVMAIESNEQERLEFTRFFFVDRLAGYELGITALVFWLLSPFLIREGNRAHFFLLASLTGAFCSNHLAIYWASIQAALVSLVFCVENRNEAHTRAAIRNFLIINFVAELFALLGAFFIGYGATPSLDGTQSGFLWTTLSELAKQLSPQSLKLGFLLFVIGFGFAAGIAPLHSSLPNLFSRFTWPSLTLICALLSNAALHGILRCHALCRQANEGEFASKVLIVIGLISVGIGALSIWVQRDIKRFFFYFNPVGVGIVLVGAGIGNSAAAGGAALVMAIQSLAKSSMILSVWPAAESVGTRAIRKIHGIGAMAPVLGQTLFLGALGWVAAAPFGGFAATYSILTGLVYENSFWVIVCALTGQILAGLGVMWTVSKMVFGKKTFSGSIQRVDVRRRAALFIPILGLLALGLGVYAELGSYFEKIAWIITGKS